jgi:uncharacterized protein with PIN domain
MTVKMSNTRCPYCGRFVHKVNDNKRCLECEKEYKSVIAGIVKRYGGVIKKLAER